MTRSYRAFGDYLLLRRLEQDALSELWRAARIEGNRLGPAIALRRFHGGDLAALRRAAMAARGVVGQIEGTTIVREQIIDVAEGSPFVAHAYPGGRSLRGIADRARAGHPIPTDQALGIAERLTASVQMLQGMKLQDRRLVHGALIPQFVWISEEGEVRVAGQQLAGGIIASLGDASIRSEIGPFIAPEVRAGGEPSPRADVYSIGAALFLMLTGEEPPVEGDQTVARLREARLALDDEEMPGELRSILDQTLAVEPERRLPSSEVLHQALTKLIAGGYAPTTFNLAFYLHTLLKDEMEEEARERDEEARLDPAPFVAQKKEAARMKEPAAAPLRAPVRAETAAPVLSQPAGKRSRLPLALAAVVLLMAGSAAAYLLVQRSTEPRVAQAEKSAPVPGAVDGDGPFGGETPPPAPQLTALAAAGDEGEAGTALDAVAGTAVDEEARRRAFEEEVDRRLREEVARLQAEYEKQLAAERARANRAADSAKASPSPVVATPPPAQTATVAEARTDPDQLNRKTLDQLRDERAAPAAEPAPASPSQPQPQPTPSAEVAPQTPPAAAAPPPAAVREGDLVDLAALDRPPTLTRKVSPEYPPIARKRRISGSVILTVLIDERGEVAEVRILRGDATKIGFDDAAVKAARQMRFTPPMKDGKRVRTWLALPVNFQLAD